MKRIFLFVVAGLAALVGAARAGDIATTNGVWTDAKRSREIPYKIYAPANPTGRLPVIIFSHGLGGSREGYSYLGSFWASNGFVSIHIQHEGSDDGVWRDAPAAERMKAMQTSAVKLQNAIDRPRDVSFAIDQLAKLDAGAGPLRGHLDTNRIGMAGHSFGAYTTMAVAGQGGARIGAIFRDPRVKAAIAMSTPTPRPVTDAMMREVRIPVLHMTGTRDTSPVGPEQKPEDRRSPFDHTQNADAFLVVFNGGDHMVFSGVRWRGDADPNDARNHRLILSGTLAFWKAYLLDDARARQRLTGGDYAKELGDAAVFEKKIK